MIKLPTDVEKEPIELVNVVVNNETEIKQYFDLFSSMIGFREIQKSMFQRDFARIFTSKYEIRFMIMSHNRRGYKCHHLLNLVQDEEMHREVAIPMTNIQRFIY